MTLWQLKAQSAFPESEETKSLEETAPQGRTLQPQIALEEGDKIVTNAKQKRQAKTNEQDRVNATTPRSKKN